MKNLIFIISTFLITIFFSCSEKSNENIKLAEHQNELFLQFQDRFNEAGVDNIYDNYTLSDNEIKRLKAVTNELPNTKIASFKSVYNDGSVVYGFWLPKPDQYLTIKLSEGRLSKLFKAKIQTLEDDTKLVLSTENDTEIQSFSFINDINGNFENRNNNLKKYSKSYGDCDELGERRSGESFDDCFKRNWSDFCCDFIGCMAQITNPTAVAAAITLVCVC